MERKKKSHREQNQGDKNHTLGGEEKVKAEWEIYPTDSTAAEQQWKERLFEMLI